MNVRVLIHSIVRQTTVLIAQLATSGGVRAPLAQIANQVFLDLTSELEEQGVSRKVSADMFGMALRAYQKKIQRLNESSTFQGKSLWEAVLERFDSGHVLARAEVMRRFRHDDEVLVRGVLHDLVESGLISCSGSGARAVYRKTTLEERSAFARNGEGLEDFVWALVFREGPLTIEQLARASSLTPDALSVPLVRLQDQGRVSFAGGTWHAHGFSVPLGAEAGWEAAMFDHYHALVKTLCARMAAPPEKSELRDEIGGSTYTMSVWPGHPVAEEARSTLRRFREQLAELQTRVRQYNSRHVVPANYQAISVYAGQCITEEGLPQENDDDHDEKTSTV
jgi:hypothetical protein